MDPNSSDSDSDIFTPTPDKKEKKEKTQRSIYVLCRLHRHFKPASPFHLFLVVVSLIMSFLIGAHVCAPYVVDRIMELSEIWLGPSC